MSAQQALTVDKKAPLQHPVMVATTATICFLLLSTILKSVLPVTIVPAAQLLLLQTVFSQLRIHGQTTELVIFVHMVNFVASSLQLHLNANQVLLFHIWVHSLRQNAYHARTANTATLLLCRIPPEIVVPVTTALLVARQPPKQDATKTTIVPLVLPL